MRPIVAMLLAGTVLSTSACAGNAERRVYLTVHVGAFGGPARPDGGMALSDAPQPGVRITVTDAAGHAMTRGTDRGGRATFTVAPGRYVVASSECGPTTPRRVTVARVPVTVNIICAIP